MKRQLTGVLLLLVMLAAVLYSADVRGSILTAGERCLTVLIPSLYLYSLLAALCIRTGALRMLGRTPPGLLLVTVLFSQIGGYPVGAQLLHGQRAAGLITPEEECRLLCICMGCGPGFLLGTVCRGLPPGLSAWMYLSVSLPPLLCLLWVRAHGEEPLPPPAHEPFAASLTQAAEGAASAMLKITAMVLAFAGGMGILDGMGVFAWMPERAELLLRSLLEVSQVTMLLEHGGSLPAAAAVLSFGGLCVHCQLAAICGGNVDWLRLLGLRAVFAVMSAGICAAGVRFLFREVQPAALTETRTALTTGSLLPGACLLVMSVMLLREHDRSAS